jgi:nucleoside 2-deoxyribosyltransferase
MIYLASPYTARNGDGSLDLSLMEERYLLVEEALAKCVQRKIHALSPIVLFHSLAFKHALPPHASFWRAHNRALLQRCDALYVLCLPGWDTSLGIAYELGVAHALGLPVYALATPASAPVRMES